MIHRKSFLKLLGMLPLLAFRPPSRISETVPQYQQEPPSAHWSDIWASGTTPNGQKTLVDISALNGSIKSVHGFFSCLSIHTDADWLIEARPSGIPGSLSYAWLYQGGRSLNEISVPIFMRCNQGKFEVRLHHQDGETIEWSFSPVAWFL